MDLVKVSANRRQASGKNGSRRLRASGQIPAVAYGKGESALSLSVTPKDLVGVLALPRGRNSVIELDVEGNDKFVVLLTDYQYHPVSRTLLHADFLKIALDQPVEVEIPLELTGKAKGVVDGGVLRQVYRRLPVRCLPKDIPVNVTHDITELGLDESLHVSELAVPEGVTVRLPLEQTVAAVAMEKIVVEEEVAPTAEAAAAAAAGATPAAPGAPGAPGAPAPAEGTKPEPKA